MIDVEDYTAPREHANLRINTKSSNLFRTVWPLGKFFVLPSVRKKGKCLLAALCPGIIVRATVVLLQKGGLQRRNFQAAIFTC